MTVFEIIATIVLFLILATAGAMLQTLRAICKRCGVPTTNPAEIARRMRFPFPWQPRRKKQQEPLEKL